eukprot:1158664-Pelagomonas_calceolata.AAC.2
MAVIVGLLAHTSYSTPPTAYCTLPSAFCEGCSQGRLLLIWCALPCIGQLLAGLGLPPAGGHERKHLGGDTST